MSRWLPKIQPWILNGTKRPRLDFTQTGRERSLRCPTRSPSARPVEQPISAFEQTFVDVLGAAKPGQATRSSRSIGHLIAV